MIITHVLCEKCGSSRVLKHIFYSKKIPVAERNVHISLFAYKSEHKPKKIRMNKINIMKRLAADNWGIKIPFDIYLR